MQRPTPGASAEVAFQGGGELAERLRLAVTRLWRRLRQHADVGVTQSQLSALSSLRRLGPLTLGELATTEGVQPPSMTRVVANLEADGLVRRQVDSRDRRVSHVGLTQDGARILHRSRSRKSAYLAGRIEQLSGEERSLLARATELLERILEEPE